MILLDLFAGELGWSSEFARRGWKVYAVDLKEPSRTVPNVAFIKADVLTLGAWTIGCNLWTTTGGLFLNCFPDFIVASSPCEEFSVHGMKHFHPNPPYPELGIKLFNHTRSLCESAGVPYVMENVKPAQDFVGRAVTHCGPFYLWGTGVPPLMPQGIRKNMVMGNSQLVNELKRNGDREAIKKYRRQFDLTWNSSKSKARKEATAKAATIPPELSNCVADYAERILEK